MVGRVDGCWVARLVENDVNSAQALAMDGPELTKKEIRQLKKDFIAVSMA